MTNGENFVTLSDLDSSNSSGVYSWLWSVKKSIYVSSLVIQLLIHPNRYLKHSREFEQQSATSEKAHRVYSSGYGCGQILIIFFGAPWLLFTLPRLHFDNLKLNPGRLLYGHITLTISLMEFVLIALIWWIAYPDMMLFYCFP